MTTMYRNQQLLEDEKFAMMLQNEEFMRELRGNQEFMSALADDDFHDCDMTGQESQQHQTFEKPKDASSRRPHLGMDDAVFREASYSSIVFLPKDKGNKSNSKLGNFYPHL